MMADTTDILIVGGGVIGTSIAYHLAKRKAGKVLLLEKSFLAAGSSGKSGAIIRQHYSNALTIDMSRQSMRVFENMALFSGRPVMVNQTDISVRVGN